MEVRNPPNDGQSKITSYLSLSQSVGIRARGSELVRSELQIKRTIRKKRQQDHQSEVFSMRNENNEKQEKKTNEVFPNIIEQDTIHDQSHLDDQHNTEINPEDLPADYQKCILLLPRRG